jgi:hypothetical protein
MAVAVLVVTSAVVTTTIAQRASIPKPPPDKLVLGEGEVKQLLRLMDTDKNGKISKQEFMAFMEAEFERLDNHFVLAGK